MTLPPRQDRPLPPPVRRGEGPGLPLPGRPATPTAKALGLRGSKAPRTAPNEKVCQKCGALFRWEHPGADQQGAPLTLKLMTPGQKCDCGYGAVRAKPRKP
ncbi:hypothetical protein HEQ60_08955 [Haematospirillum sp. H1815]|uniref:hypothetical protein n=1 Tax=Haematospirillum sp. H1815 TaxID=2723108 RepID=UPI00143A7BE4|nr:hypothetical protein [Haematospirillum sp. H1815]NKD77884.1 hypothetical protein [Haematospirillum sp. H1815]